MLYPSVDAHVLAAFSQNCKIRYHMDRSDYDDTFLLAAKNFGYTWGAELEYYMGFWADSYPLDNFDPPPDDVLKAVLRMAESPYPRILLKMYRLQRGLE